MKALIVDPALHSMGGHHYNAVLRLRSELAGLGVDAPCLGSAYADRNVVEKLACTPTFTRSVYGRTYTTHAEFDRDVEETSGQLSRAMRRLGALPDLIVLPCCDQVLASALARHLERARLAPPPELLLWLLYGPHHMKSTDDPAPATGHGEYRGAFAALKAAVGDSGRIRAYCETSPMADFYRGLLDLDVGVRPGPGLVAPARTRLASDGQGSTVSCIGFANRAKGYGLLPDTIERVLQQRPHVRFMIHGVVKGSDAEADRPIFDRLAGLGERIVTRRDVLTPEEYLAWLAEADLLLLPYDPEVYRSRGSGVFIDARNMGIPVVVTGGCAFAQPAFEGGWGVAIGEQSARGVCLAVLDALDRLEDLSACAALAAGGTPDDLGRILRATIDGIRARRPLGLAGILRRFGPRSA